MKAKDIWINCLQIIFEEKSDLEVSLSQRQEETISSACTQKYP